VVHSFIFTFFGGKKEHDLSYPLLFEKRKNGKGNLIRQYHPVDVIKEKKRKKRKKKKGRR